MDRGPAETDGSITIRFAFSLFAFFVLSFLPSCHGNLMFLLRRIVESSQQSSELPVA